MSHSIDELRQIVTETPGAPEFVELAKLLCERDSFAEAMDVCFAGLSTDPSNDRGRLLLAKIFFEQGHIPFAAREVRDLYKNNPDSSSLKSLLDKLQPDLASETQSEQSEEEVIAEADFEFDILEDLEDED